MLPTDSTEVLIAGDFNCVTSQADCTGKPNMSRALTTLIRGMGLCDVWTTHHTSPPIHITQMWERQGLTESISPTPYKAARKEWKQLL